MPRPTILIQPASGEPRAPITPEEWETARRSLPGPDVNPCCRCGAGGPFGFRYSRDVALWACAEHRWVVEAQWRAGRRAPADSTPTPQAPVDLFGAPESPIAKPVRPALERGIAQ